MRHLHSGLGRETFKLCVALINPCNLVLNLLFQYGTIHSSYFVANQPNCGLAATAS